jgi:hypothetical protein
MGANQIGLKVRLAINTGTVETPVWSKLEKETTLTLTLTADEIEALNKDSGVFKEYIKTFLSAEVSFAAQQSIVPQADFFNYADMFGLYTETFTSATKGVRQIKVFSTDIGSDSIAFAGFIKSLNMPSATADLLTYDGSIRIISLPILTPVAA